MAVPPREFDIPSNATHADFREWESGRTGVDALYGRRAWYRRRRLPWKMVIGIILVAAALLLLLVF